MEDMIDSEFGKGFAYCLGLFLAHAERINDFDLLGHYYLFFSGAYDHLIEINTDPMILGQSLADDVVDFRNFCQIRSRFDAEGVTREECYYAVRVAKNLLLRWDMQCNIPAFGAEYD